MQLMCMRRKWLLTILILMSCGPRSQAMSPTAVLSIS
jgi:hypothetical protein